MTEGVTPRCDAGSREERKRECILRALLPELFLDTASGCGMTEGVTPRCDAGSRVGRKRNGFGGLSCLIFSWIPHRGAV